MKVVAVFPESREVKVTEREVPRIGEPRQVLLRMLDIGVCGTDKEICSFEYGTPPPGDDCLVIGHESLAEVVAVGPAVERLGVGDLVVPSVRRPCPHAGCLACRSGHQDYCYTGDFTERGIKEAHGYMAEYVVDHERYLHPVPPDLRDLAVLTEPLTIAEKALQQIFWIMQQRPAPFRYRDKGIMATIGYRSAVVELPRRVRFHGTFAWLVWLALHIITLLGGRNRISALVNMSSRYLTWQHGGGLIVGDGLSTGSASLGGAAAVPGQAEGSGAG